MLIMKARLHIVICSQLLLVATLAIGRTTTQATSLATLRSSERELVELIDRLSKTVVAITAVRKVDWPGDKQIGRNRLGKVRGSGFIISPEGHILTNEHVVRRSASIMATLWDGGEYSAEVVGSDPRTDLAVLKIPPKNLPTAKLGDVSRVRRGQWVLAIGNSFGLAVDGQSAASLGIVSAIGRHLPELDPRADRYYGNLIQTTAQIDVGNSGGPLFSLSGEVIGINTIIPATEVPGSSHVAFSMPITKLTRRIIQKLLSGEKIRYGYLGIRMRGVPGRAGALVDMVNPGTPAHEAGIKPGDLITEYGKEKIGKVDDVIRLLALTPPGTTVELKINRKGRIITKSVKTASRKKWRRRGSGSTRPKLELKGHQREK